MARFLDERGGRRLLDPALVRAAWSETYYNLALACLKRSRRAALPWLLRSLAAGLGHAGAWRALAYLGVPAPLWYGLRRALGRPEQGHIRRRLPACPAGPITSP
jgi:hypothetical protein